MNSIANAYKLIIVCLIMNLLISQSCTYYGCNVNFYIDSMLVNWTERERETERERDKLVHRIEKETFIS